MQALNVVVGVPLSEQEEHLLALLEFMGFATREIPAEGGTAAVKDRVEEASPSFAVLAMSADRLSILCASPSEAEPLVEFLRERCRALLVYGWQASPTHGDALARLTSGTVRPVCVDGSASQALQFSDDELCGPVSGLAFPVAPPETVFALQAASPSRPLLLHGKNPVFLLHELGDCSLFLLSSPGVPDIRMSLSRSQEGARYHLRLIPYVVFLRASLPESGWHGVQPTARLIIDDPLLRDVYGFLDFRKLNASMNRHGYGASVAFIPWNYRRTSEHFAAWLSVASDRWSVCVHGCDHTGNEFGIEDATHLGRKSRLAMERMQAQKDRTGLGFEEVMVFPQGRFSTHSVKALQRTNFLAAVNSHLFPMGATEHSLTIGDFARPAMTRFHGFPVFLRHYPLERIDFAFDLLMGKPAFIVVHHGDFEGGCGDLERLVQWLHGAEANLTWPSLSEQVMRSCLVRWLDSGTLEAMFFTRRFRIENPHGRKLKLVLTKYEPDYQDVDRILIDGKQVDLNVEKDWMRLECEWNPGETISVEIRYGSEAGVFRGGARYDAKVAARRYLSEFRDHSLSRHPLLLKMATGSLKAVRAIRR